MNDLQQGEIKVGNKELAALNHTVNYKQKLEKIHC